MHKRTSIPCFSSFPKRLPLISWFFFFLAMLFVQILIFSVGHFKSCFVDQNSLNESFSHVCAGISPPDDNALLSVCLAHHPVGVCAHCASGPWGSWGAESVWNSAWSLLSWVVGRSVPLSGCQGCGRENEPWKMQVLGGRDTELGFVFTTLFVLNVYTNLRSVAREGNCYYVALFLSR